MKLGKVGKTTLWLAAGHKDGVLFSSKTGLKDPKKNCPKSAHGCGKLDDRPTVEAAIEDNDHVIVSQNQANWFL